VLKRGAANTARARAVLHEIAERRSLQCGFAGGTGAKSGSNPYSVGLRPRRDAISSPIALRSGSERTAATRGNTSPSSIAM
jgi:hypothetical protein